MDAFIASTNTINILRFLTPVQLNGWKDCKSETACIRLILAIVVEYHCKQPENVVLFQNRIILSVITYCIQTDPDSICLQSLAAVHSLQTQPVQRNLCLRTVLLHMHSDIADMDRQMEPGQDY